MYGQEREAKMRISFTAAFLSFDVIFLMSTCFGGDGIGGNGVSAKGLDETALERRVRGFCLQVTTHLFHCVLFPISEAFDTEH